MRALIRWAAHNSPAVNVLLIAVMVVGAICAYTMRREVFPEFDLEIILVSVPYPGATPSEVEEGICQKIEESVRSISGIKKQTSIAQEGGGFLVLELKSSVKDVQRVLNEVRAEIDRIPSFPELAEDPEVTQITFRAPAIRLGVVGPADDSPAAELALREFAEAIREDLLQLGSVSQANLVNAKSYQIDVEISEETLRNYGLTLREVAQVIRRENIEIPGGKMQTSSQDVLLRGKNKRLTGAEIARIPLVTTADGVVLTVGDLGTVRDEFDDREAINRLTVLDDGVATDAEPGEGNAGPRGPPKINDRPAMIISVDRTSSEDLLKMVEQVKGYVAEKNRSLPPGYSLYTWQDSSVDVKDRMHLLINDGTQGLLLVFLVLAIFLDLRLGFWVALGIPVAVLGSAIVLYFAGQTMNMLSMFSFLLALGIVVDDAIVIGENVYAYRQAGYRYQDAAIEATCEVWPSVAASVCTTIIAFVPLLFVAGVMGKFIAVMPLAVISMLVISLLETTISLPCHLAHKDNLFYKFLGIVLYPLRPVPKFVLWLNVRAHWLLQTIIEVTYVPTIQLALRHRFVAVSIGLAILIFSFGLIRSGITPFILFPKLDSNVIESQIAFADGTPREVTDAATRRIEQALMRVHQRHAAEGEPIVTLIHRAVGENSGQEALGPDGRTAGGNVGGVYVELVDTAERTITSEQILREWREESGAFLGVERLTFGTPNFGPGGAAIEFKLLAPAEDFPMLEQAAEECKAKLAEYPGVYDIRDDSVPGKWEYQLRIKDQAVAMGVTAADLAETVRAAYWGDEVMRLQRGRHEVKLMVRYPEQQRRSLADFEEIRIRTGDGSERPLTEVAEVKMERSYSEINRIEQMRSITIVADVNDDEGNAYQIVENLRTGFMPGLMEKNPRMRVRWEGQKEQSNESVRSLLYGFSIAIFAMYCLLTIEFKSYIQPILILAIIPFGFVGALWGHAILGLPITLFSMFGLVTLTGVVVNDSIVLMDFINHHLRRGMPLQVALVEAGRRRFRPVLLTQVTTVVGLTPILMETSFQAQVLIPMAASMAFGLMASTGVVMVLVPVTFGLYADLHRWATGREAVRPDHDEDEDETHVPEPATVAPPETAPVALGAE